MSDHSEDFLPIDEGKWYVSPVRGEVKGYTLESRILKWVMTRLLKRSSNSWYSSAEFDWSEPATRVSNAGCTFSDSQWFDFIWIGSNKIW